MTIHQIGPGQAPGDGLLVPSQGPEVVLLNVEHSNLTQRFPEMRFNLHMTIEQVKHRLYRSLGTAPSAMLLHLRDQEGKTLHLNLDNERKLGYYSPKPGFTLHVIDTDPATLVSSQAVEDTSQVAKYNMSEEAYESRGNTFRKFKQQLVGSGTIPAPDSVEGAPEAATSQGELEAEEKHFAEAIGQGARCEVDPGARRGVVKWYGEVSGLPAGRWVGIHYDEPVGKNDGSINGTVYFESPMPYGGFARPDRVHVGDFPPFNDFEDVLGEEDEL